MISPRLRNWIALIVTIVWAINFAATLVPQLHYKPDPTIHAVFMGIVGGAFALSRDKKEQADKQKELEDKKVDKEGKPS